MFSIGVFGRENRKRITLFEGVLSDIRHAVVGNKLFCVFASNMFYKCSSVGANSIRVILGFAVVAYALSPRIPLYLKVVSPFI